VRKIALLGVVLTLLSGSFSCSGSVITAHTMPKCVVDSDGKAVDVFAKDGLKATVLFFIATGCPISNSYSPKINRIFKEFVDSGVKSYAVLTDDTLTTAQAKQYGQTYEYSCPLVLDPHHTLVSYAGATVTPEAAVFDVAGKLIYRGRIDNKFADFGISRQSATTDDLVAVLKAALLGHKPTLVTTKAIGCFIPQPVS
jgi:hypothetical protein